MKKTKKGGKSPLGVMISQLATERGYAKPSEFAEKNGINLGTFNDLIYGNTKVMPDSLVAVAKALQVQPSRLLASLEEETQSPSSEQSQNQVATEGSTSDTQAIASAVARLVVKELVPKLDPIGSRLTEVFGQDLIDKLLSASQADIDLIRSILGSDEEEEQSPPIRTHSPRTKT